MTDIEQVVRECFANVFPTVPREALPALRQDSDADWDSVAHVTLIAALSEALDVDLDFDVFAEARSYAEVLALARAVGTP